MLEITGNLWDPRIERDVTVITTNGIVKANGACVMGRGCAQQARDMFIGIDRRLGSYIQHWGNRPYNLGWFQAKGGHPYTIVSFPVKHHWRDEASAALIRQSCIDLIAMADKFDWQHILMPQPGCGNGRLQWSDISLMLSALLDDRFTVITYGGTE